jgi:hypothetical protein
MKMTKLFLATVAIAAISFSGCKKNSESNTDKLTGKNWKITALTVDPPLAGGITDVYAQIPSCSQDDLTKFTTPSAVTFDEGATKCNASDPQTTTGSWAWNSDETILSITDDSGTTDSYTILSLSSSEMKAKFTDNSSGVVETFTVTFKAQ